MTRYSVYLEIADDGRRMAHMPSLPGCTVRAPAGTRPRAGLLALVRDRQTQGKPPDDVLDWQPDLQSFSIRCLLRHLDNAEDLRAAS